ncbi:Rep family protein [Vagococcus humatus]|uniref:Plasmid replication protein origin binding domain-containing protein n=1 Tax=Vagococcus humatus TaxID=1889241 RepID=A0A3S0ADE3_9ENTE|nr:Rep family protein [Vagococcus humatus]RST89214.1 hypothetical protein C7P63_05410 [Vagococcus humatus]
MMINQSLEHFNLDVIELTEVLEKIVKAKRYAFIIHDDNEEFKHIHIILEFENARHITSIAKLLDIEPQYIEVWKGSIKNAYSYLLHRTDEARKENKKQYSPKNVVANFDFEMSINEIETILSNNKDLKNKRKNEVNKLIELFDLKIIDKQALLENLSGIEYAHNEKTIISIEKMHLKKIK